MTDPAPDDGLYDFAPAAPSPHPSPKPEKKATPPPAAATVLQYRAVKPEKAKPAEPQQLVDVYLPIALLAGGIFLQLLSALVWTHQIGWAMTSLTVDLTVGTGIMLLAMWIATKARGISLGNVGVAAYKLAAIAVAPAGAMTFIFPLLSLFGFVGWLLALGVEFVLCFTLLGALFDLDESDTWYCVSVMFIVRVALYFALRFLF